MMKLRLKNLFEKKKKPSKLVSKRLEGTKVCLRKLVVKDAPFAHDTYEELRFSKYNPFNKLDSIDDYIIYLTNYTANYDTGKSVGWAITSTKTKEFIGVIQVPHYYHEDGNSTILFYIMKGLNKSYLEEAIKLVCSYLFSTNLVRRVQAKIDAEDTFNEEVLKKCKFVLDGIQRKYALYNNEYHDIKVYSLLKEEIVLLDAEEKK